MSLERIPESHADILDKPGFAHLATIGPEGEPQSHPVWYDVEDGHVVFSTTTDRQKYRNLQRDKRVSMSITDPDDPYRYLEIRGEVAAIEPDEDKSFIDRLAKRYLDLGEYPNKNPDADRVTLHVAPRHTATMG